MLLAVDTPTAPDLSQEYVQFVTVLGRISILVVASMFIERALAFVYEVHAFVDWTTEEVDGERKSTPFGSNLKAGLALGLSLAICFMFEFDALSTVFGVKAPTSPQSFFGKLVTGFVMAGGSAGAIALFQGVLGFSKQARDATTEARRIQAEARKADAERARLVARTELEVAEATARAAKSGGI